MSLNKIKIKHPTPKVPPHPTKRDECLAEWKEIVTKIYKNNAPKTIEEAEKFTPELERAEKELDEKFKDDYEVIVNFNTSVLEKLIEKYGPLKIGIDKGEILAFTEMNYQYPEGYLKRIKNRIKRYAKGKLQKLSRAKNKG